MTIYCLAFCFYLYVRVTHTLDLGRFLPYGIFVLIVEIMGATTTILYGVNILLHPIHEDIPDDPAHPGLPKVRPALSQTFHERKRARVRACVCVCVGGEGGLGMGAG